MNWRADFAQKAILLWTVVELFFPRMLFFKTVWATDPLLVSNEWYLDVAHGGKERKRYFQRVIMPGIKVSFFKG